MRTHAEIIRSHGASALVRDLAAREVRVHQSTPQRWVDRDSIPGEYWQVVVDLGIATLEELAAAAALSRASKAEARSEAA